ncbi:MAG: PilN domain-containing protein [Candidatus Eisenbacteria sp.]|nr:PilN domain-containing protein [Candidatus Eisenbacteria bacterium]
MYDVNLIRQRLFPGSRKRVVTVIVSLSALVLGLTLVSIGTISLTDFRTTSVYATDVVGLQERVATRYPGVPDLDYLLTIIGRTDPYLKDIGKMVTARIRLAPIWERIALAVPEGVWLTSVSISDRRDPGEQMTGKSRSFRGILIAGVALAGRGPEGDQAVAAFVENLKSDEGLQDIVDDVEFMGTGLEQVGGTSVVGFEITCPF